MKTIGVIGGLGPETTAEFYLGIVFECARVNQDHRPAILTWNVPIPYSVEEAALLNGIHLDKIVPLLIDGAQRLEKSGVDFLVMPCNSLHRFVEQIRANVKIPMLSVIDAVVDLLRSRGVTEIGLIGTTITVDSGFYQKALTEAGIKVVLPDEFQQAKLGKMIHGLVSNHYANRQREELLLILKQFEAGGLKSVLLACTDLQALVPHHPTLQIFDSMKILADAAVAEMCR